MIKLKNITKKFNEKRILSNINLEIKNHEMIAFTGASGSGKTTLLNIIGLLENPTSGSIWIDEIEISGLSNIQKLKILKTKFGFLFQNFALIDSKSIYDNLEFCILKKSKKEKIEIIENVLKDVKIENDIFKKVHQLSGGEQQRVAIARLMLKNSEIILADEPTGSLDEKNRNIIIELLKKLNETKTVIIVTHDPYVAKSCDRIIEILNMNEE